MASARQRDGRWTGLYRDRLGRQRSASTYGHEGNGATCVELASQAGRVLGL
jgi:hypothetical protein